jgi:cardiolipin synthase
MDIPFYETTGVLWPVYLLLVLGTSIHAVLYKSNYRSVVLWIALIWFSPLLGAIFYSIFGVNRITKTAKSLKNIPKDHRPHPSPVCDENHLVEVPDHLIRMVNFGSRVNPHPLVPGNRVAVYNGGDEAYPEMLDSIHKANSTIILSSYIFNRDQIGLKFVDALSEAKKRGVEIRVLVDATGSKYSFPTIFGSLKKAGIIYAKFLPLKFPFLLTTTNMRNHRKILVIDGKVGFTGGMNISDKKLKKISEASFHKDIHFKFEGPIVNQFTQAFSEDWFFSVKEKLGQKWFPKLTPKGEILGRSIIDGPDAYFEKIQLTLLGILSQAKHTIKIVTPYFLPDATLKSAIKVAVYRGVRVQIILPGVNNIPLVKWASYPDLRQLIREGVEIFESDPPFDHTKLIVVDDMWSLVGSTNLDPRSLRLNFEFNVECYDKELAINLDDIFEDKKRSSKKLTLNYIDSLSVFHKIRNGLSRILSPIL